MELITPNKSRANAVRILFYATMALNIISAFSNYSQIVLLESLQNGDIISPDVISSNDHRQKAIAIFMLLLIIGTIITFIMWFFRAYKNLHILKIKLLQHSPGWAIGAWFVPFLNLVRPFQIMNEIWENTQIYSQTR